MPEKTCRSAYPNPSLPEPLYTAHLSLPSTARRTLSQILREGVEADLRAAGVPVPPVPQGRTAAATRARAQKRAAKKIDTPHDDSV